MNRLKNIKCLNWSICASSTIRTILFYQSTRSEADKTEAKNAQMTKIKVTKYPINKKDKTAILKRNADIDHLKKRFYSILFRFLFETKFYLSLSLMHSINIETDFEINPMLIYHNNAANKGVTVHTSQIYETVASVFYANLRPALMHAIEAPPEHAAVLNITDEAERLAYWRENGGLNSRTAFMFVLMVTSTNKESEPYGPYVEWSKFVDHMLLMQTFNFALETIKRIKHRRSDAFRTLDQRNRFKFILCLCRFFKSCRCSLIDEIDIMKATFDDVKLDLSLPTISVYLGYRPYNRVNPDQSIDDLMLELLRDIRFYSDICPNIEDGRALHRRVSRLITSFEARH